ncbi:MAG: DUF4097 family beta strand repeat-containing protein [Gemmatimonadaceae bacterium]|nr:DUF4097 family beta strand repeat-containing protein [Gemmatimonadaceae bacterium]
MIPSARSTTLAALLLLTTGATAGAQRVVGRDDVSWSTREQLSSGDRLRIASPNGPITITQGTGAEVEIRAEKTAEQGASIDDIGFIVKRAAGGLVVCAVYDDDDECDMERGYRTGARRSRDGWRNRARASFTVRIPRGVLVQAETGNGAIAITGAGSEVRVVTGNGGVLVSGTTGRVEATTGNGRVTVEDASGPVEATTGNGDVRVTTSNGPVTARSGNGNIDVTMARVERAAAMNFSTGIGRITVGVPEGFGAEMDASSGHGDVTSDVPLRIEGRPHRRHLRGTLGEGGERLTLSTGNGDIAIRRAR